MKATAYGGQAVIEGVMMRSRSRSATAVRAPDGSIVVESSPIVPGRLARSMRRIPILRGTFALWDVFALGARSLAFSAQVAIADPEDADSDQADSNGYIALMLVLGLGLGIALFFLAPLFLASLADRWIESDFASNAAEGLIRIAVVVGYLAAIGLLPDIYRTLQYHGAEHKTVNAIEARLPLTVENVQTQSLLHPRCGTSFLLLVVVISIIGFALLGRPDLWVRLGSRIVLIPIAAGIAFEFITLLAKHRDRTWARALIAPGFWLQGLTTRRPDAAQCAVAIAAIAPVLTDIDRELLVPEISTLPLSGGAANLPTS